MRKVTCQLSASGASLPLWFHPSQSSDGLKHKLINPLKTNTGIWQNHFSQTEASHKFTIHCIFTWDPAECTSACECIHSADSRLISPSSPGTLTHQKNNRKTLINAVKFITTPDFRINEYMISCGEKKRKKETAYKESNLNRIDLNSNKPPRLLAAAEFACVGLYLFEGVRACSALFTVKRMKMNSQIVLHL